MCVDEQAELKWSHFFQGPHQSRGTNPLLCEDPKTWREQAAWALGKLYDQPGVLPVTTYLRKDRASPAHFRPGVHGGQVLRTDLLWTALFGQFAIFLDWQDASGEVWWDQLGSRKEENGRQAEWDSLRSATHPRSPADQRAVNRISPRLRFCDSATEALMQIADFVSGVIWDASEGDEDFLLQLLDQYGDRWQTVHVS